MVTPLADGRGRLDSFVGRREELRRVELSCADVVRLGQGRLVTVTGEAGVGKTRFCQEVADLAREAGMTVVWGRCWADGGAPPLWPWQSILSGLGGAEAGSLLDGDAGLDGVDPERFARFVAVGDRLAAAGERAPICLVLDDLHAADPGALLLTRFVARSLDRLPVLLLATRRTDQPPVDPTASRLLDELEGEATMVVLRAFELHETDEFVSTRGGELAPDLLEAVQRVAKGSPLVLRRLLAHGAPLSADTLPDGLRSTVDETMDRLGAEAVRVLELAAVLGQTASVAEAVALTGASTAAVLEALRLGRDAGLVADEGMGSFAFAHELVREAIEARLPLVVRLDAHARAAAELDGAAGEDAPERLARRAHHAVVAAARSAEDARLAVAACREAARSMVRRFAYERAAALLGTAMALCERPGVGPASAALYLERAQATLLCGRLGEARPHFDAVAEAAEREGEPVVFAQAALGLGGVWANEYRHPVERERVEALQRRALEGLPASEAVLRARLATRLAAQAVFHGGPIEAVFPLVREVRRLGDGRALAEALSLLHHAMLGPEFMEVCLALADELIAIASASGEGVMALMGLCLRAVDLYQLGDPQAERALADLRARADALGCQSILYVVALLDVMRLIRSGRLEDAEAEAARCYQMGTEVGDADALGYYGAHLVAIRWLQGRGAEIVDLVDEIATSPMQAQQQFVFPAALASLAAEAGQRERARVTLDRLASGGLAALPQSSTWLAGMLAISDAAVTLGDLDLARQAYALLQRFAHLAVMPSLAISCFGSVERPLGVLALALGDVDGAVRHLERAVAANQRLDNQPLVAWSRADLAAALRHRGALGDRARAEELLAEAVRAARSMGMTARANAWASTAGWSEHDGRGVFRRAGRKWLVSLAGREVVLEDRVGMGYLAHLLARSGVEISAVTLVGGDADGAPSGAEERARTAVRKAIRRALDDISAADPAIGAVLQAGVRTGYQCSYTPDPRAPVTWAVGGGGPFSEEEPGSPDHAAAG